MRHTKKIIHIGIIGAGVMGTSLARNILHKKITNPSAMVVSDTNQSRLNRISKELCVRTTKNNAALIDASDIVLLAIKPQDFASLADTLPLGHDTHKIFISIMAGVPLSALKKKLLTSRVVRTMPNLAASVGQAFVVWKSGFTLTKTEKETIEMILSSLGETLAVKSEDDIDKATAISGSGPAYLYYLMEQLTAAARTLGFTDIVARRMIEQTIRGAWHVYEQSKKTPAVLRAQVTSRHGTTEAALQSFALDKLPKIIERGVKAAYRRARELSQS